MTFPAEVRYPFSSCLYDGVTEKKIEGILSPLLYVLCTDVNHGNPLVMVVHTEDLIRIEQIMGV